MRFLIHRNTREYHPCERIQRHAYYMTGLELSGCDLRARIWIRRFLLLLSGSIAAAKLLSYNFCKTACSSCNAQYRAAAAQTAARSRNSKTTTIIGSLIDCRWGFGRSLFWWWSDRSTITDDDQADHRLPMMIGPIIDYRWRPLYKTQRKQQRHSVPLQALKVTKLQCNKCSYSSSAK